MIQTLLGIRNGKIAEYPSNDGHKLKDKILDYGYGATIVYGYILNRHPRFQHKFYGWGLPRN